MKGIIKERRKDLPGFIYRFVCISAIQNNFLRRLALVASFPVFFSFNCVMSSIAIVIFCITNNRKLVETVVKRWNEPADLSEVDK